VVIVDLQLKGKTAVIAASSKGLGKAIAEELAREGANLFLCSRDEESVRSIAAELEETYDVRVSGMKVDLSDPADITKWIEHISTNTETIDALVCNSGGPPSGSFLSFDDEAWEQSFQTNLMSVIRLVRGCYPYMKQQGGRVITIASSSVKMPIPGLILSNTFRTGISGLMKTLSMELAADRILLNTVCPGRVSTDRLLELDSAKAQRTGQTLDEIQESMTQEIPLGRYGTPEEFAVFSAFLLSPKNTYMTGSVFYVDGGMVKAL
jgi:3-oxoacyl-[acyl-carrier protein] reductase